jgi:hypothetical protein
MQLKEKKNTMERDKRKLEAELYGQRQTIGKQVFMQVVQQKNPAAPSRQQQLENEMIAMQLTTSQQNQQQSSSPRTNFNSAKETPRRQWDKTAKPAIMDLETESQSTNSNNNGLKNNSTSSMSSTPSSSASQSPPMSNSNKQQTKSNNTNTQNVTSSSTTDNNQMIMSVDLSKAYYSRDEVVKAIESLKEKYGKEANSINMLLMSNNKSQQAAASNPASNNTTPNKREQAAASSSTNNGNMVKEIEILNGKLSELQNEINRLTLLQQKAPESETPNQTQANTNQQTPAPTAFVVDLNASFNLSDERKNLSSASATETTAAVAQPTQQQPDGSFFISIGNGSAKREKPPALTPKKNLIFVKSKLKRYHFCFQHNYENLRNQESSYLKIKKLTKIS